MRLIVISFNDRKNFAQLSNFQNVTLGGEGCWASAPQKVEKITIM